MPPRPGTLADPLKRDRVVVLCALFGVSTLAWLYLIDMADMRDMSRVMAAAMTISPWDATGFALMLLMWVVMMAGMMLPSATPMILLFATIKRKRSSGTPYAPTAMFVLGYLVVWTGF